MSRPELPRALKRLPLSVKVIAALAGALLPLGLLAVWMVVNGYRATGAAMSGTQWVSALLPLAMWVLALLIGWQVANILLVQPLLRVRRAVEAYGAGDHDVRLGGQDFLSEEMIALAVSFDTMADHIRQQQSDLEAALEEQKRLTREVHHRVKNNLQIVSSLLSLQSREASSADVSYAYATIQARVGALALVHRWMYDGAAVTGVDLRALATDLCAALEQGIGSAGQSAITLRCTVERFVVAQDTAVPLAFLITELASVAARRAAPDGFAGIVTAHADGAKAVLKLTAAPFIGGDLAPGDPSRRIVEGMARQLRAPLHHDGIAGTYCIEFAVPALG